VKKYKTGKKKGHNWL